MRVLSFKFYFDVSSEDDETRARFDTNSEFTRSFEVHFDTNSEFYFYTSSEFYIF